MKIRTVLKSQVERKRTRSKVVLQIAKSTEGSFIKFRETGKVDKETGLKIISIRRFKDTDYNRLYNSPNH